MVHIFCLGALRIEFTPEGATLALTPKALALFVYLAVTAAKGEPPHSRDTLADLLWSETNNRQARANLRYLLPEVRQPLDDYLIITPQSIAFRRQAPYWLDVKQLRTTLMARPETIATPVLQAALDLYQGEFLAGFPVRNAPVFEMWVVRPGRGERAVYRLLDSGARLQRRQRSTRKRSVTNGLPAVTDHRRNVGRSNDAPLLSGTCSCQPPVTGGGAGGRNHMNHNPLSLAPSALRAVCCAGVKPVAPVMFMPW